VVQRHNPDVAHAPRRPFQADALQVLRHSLFGQLPERSQIAVRHVPLAKAVTRSTRLNAGALRVAPSATISCCRYTPEYASKSARGSSEK
jgi:hypothetical protein